MSKDLYITVSPSGAGKSTYAKANFGVNVVSSDRCREIICGDENDQTVSKQAFELLHFLIQKRMELGKTICVDATSLSIKSRKPLLELCKANGYNAHLLVWNMTISECWERQKQRERRVPYHVMMRQHKQLKQFIEHDIANEIDSYASIKLVEGSPVDFATC